MRMPRRRTADIQAGSPSRMSSASASMRIRVARPVHTRGGSHRRPRRSRVTSSCYDNRAIGSIASMPCPKRTMVSQGRHDEMAAGSQRAPIAPLLAARRLTLRVVKCIQPAGSGDVARNHRSLARVLLHGINDGIIFAALESPRRRRRQLRAIDRLEESRVASERCRVPFHSAPWRASCAQVARLSFSTTDGCCRRSFCGGHAAAQRGGSPD